MKPILLTPETNYYEKLQLLVAFKGGDPDLVTKDHASDYRFDNYTEEQAAEIEVKRQYRRLMKHN
jgi:hypothetical protein